MALTWGYYIQLKAFAQGPLVLPIMKTICHANMRHNRLG